jgi:hypothetical protein
MAPPEDAGKLAPNTPIYSFHGGDLSPCRTPAEIVFAASYRVRANRIVPLTIALTKFV